MKKISSSRQRLHYFQWEILLISFPFFYHINHFFISHIHMFFSQLTTLSFHKDSHLNDSLFYVEEDSEGLMTFYLKTLLYSSLIWASKNYVFEGFADLLNLIRRIFDLQLNIFFLSQGSPFFEEEICPLIFENMVIFRDQKLLLSLVSLFPCKWI